MTKPDKIEYAAEFWVIGSMPSQDFLCIGSNDGRNTCVGSHVDPSRARRFSTQEEAEEALANNHLVREWVSRSRNPETIGLVRCKMTIYCCKESEAAK